MASAEPLPSYSLPAEGADAISVVSSWPFRVSREWAFGDSSGEGVRVCVLDSGIEAEHPAVGDLECAVRIVAADRQTTRVEEDEEGDVFGHGTACAGIIRQLAPRCQIASVRVLGPTNRGSGASMLAGLRWAVEQGFDVINMSLSSRQARAGGPPPRGRRRRLLPAPRHRRLSPTTWRWDSYPWRFSSVISVGKP